MSFIEAMHRPLSANAIVQACYTLAGIISRRWEEAKDVASMQVGLLIISLSIGCHSTAFPGGYTQGWRLMDSIANQQWFSRWILTIALFRFLSILRGCPRFQIWVAYADVLTSWVVAWMVFSAYHASPVVPFWFSKGLLDVFVIGRIAKKGAKQDASS